MAVHLLPPCPGAGALRKNGMDIARQIRKTDDNTIMIFVTQLAQYAVEGYQVDALDFMVQREVVLLTAPPTATD